MKEVKFKTEQELKIVVNSLIDCGVRFTYMGEYTLMVWTI